MEMMKYCQVYMTCLHKALILVILKFFIKA